MSKGKKYTAEDYPLSKVEEPELAMRVFSSQEEADLYRLQRNLARTDIERFEMLCRMMRIGRMLSPTKTIS